MINSRAQGGSSLNPGEIEIMHSRRLQIYDMMNGFGEGVSDID